MAVSKALLRLLRVRGIEEERRRMALEAGSQKLRNLEQARDAAFARDRQGRELMKRSAESGELADRISGLVETAAGHSQVRALAPQIEASETNQLRLQQEFFKKRTERRQAETLVEETQALDAVAEDRRSQQALDDWYGSRRFRARQDEE
jgi:hypothetical protein